MRNTFTIRATPPVTKVYKTNNEMTVRNGEQKDRLNAETLLLYSVMRRIHFIIYVVGGPLPSPPLSLRSRETIWFSPSPYANHLFLCGPSTPYWAVFAKHFEEEKKGVTIILTFSVLKVTPFNNAYENLLQN
jgi:hypothetical protein